MALVMRHEFLTFLNTTPEATATYNLVGEGFSQADEALNPTQDDKHYIHEKSGTSHITGYLPTLAFIADLESEDPVIQYLYEMGMERKIGSECVTDAVLVDMWQDGQTAGTKRAQKQMVAVRIESIRKGEAGKPLSLTGSFLYRGDAVTGEWNPTTKTFTAV